MIIILNTRMIYSNIIVFSYNIEVTYIGCVAKTSLLLHLFVVLWMSILGKCMLYDISINNNNLTLLFYS